MVCPVCRLGSSINIYPAWGLGNKSQVVRGGVLVDGARMASFDGGSCAGELPADILGVYQNVLVPVGGLRGDRGGSDLFRVEGHLCAPCSGHSGDIVRPRC